MTKTYLKTAAEGTATELGAANWLFFVGCAAVLFLLSSCGGDKGGEQASGNETTPSYAAGGGLEAMPEGHPSMPGGATAGLPNVAHQSIKPQKEVKLSEEIKSRWNEVSLEVGGAGGSGEVIIVKVGDRKDLGGGFSLIVEAFVPDYTIFGDHIGSRSIEPNNPAVLVELFKADKSVARGWVFQDFPQFDSFSHEGHDLRLLPVVAGG